MIGKQFKDRLKVPSKMGTYMNASISISNMQTADAGTYTCEVRDFPDIGGTTDASSRVHVFGTKAPSGPISSFDPPALDRTVSNMYID